MFHRIYIAFSETIQQARIQPLSPELLHRRQLIQRPHVSLAKQLPASPLNHLIDQKDLKHEIPALVPPYKPIDPDERRGPHTPRHRILGKDSKGVFVVGATVCEFLQVAEIMGMDEL